MDNCNESLRTWGILLGGVGLLLVGIGAILHVLNEFNMSRAFVRHMDTYPSRIVSDIMATNGPDTISMTDEGGRPWITIENKDKSKAEFYRVNKDEME